MFLVGEKIQASDSESFSTDSSQYTAPSDATPFLLLGYAVPAYAKPVIASAAFPLSSHTNWEDFITNPPSAFLLTCSLLLLIEHNFIPNPYQCIYSESLLEGKIKPF